MSDPPVGCLDVLREWHDAWRTDVSSYLRVVLEMGLSRTWLQVAHWHSGHKEKS